MVVFLGVEKGFLLRYPSFTPTVDAIGRDDAPFLTDGEKAVTSFPTSSVEATARMKSLIMTILGASEEQTRLNLNGNASAFVSFFAVT